MSHFPVLVIGDNPIEQLAPYAEQWDTDTPPEFAEFNSSEEDGYRQQYAESEEHQRQYLTVEDFLDQYAGLTYDKDKDAWGWWHNPDARWDWYLLGGRWRSSMKLKEGADGITGQPGVFDNEAKEGWVDTLYRRDLDLEGMREAAAFEATSRYGDFLHVTNGLEPAPAWKEFAEKYEDREEARRVYNAHSWVRALRNADMMPFMAEARDTYCIDSGGRKEYVQRAVDTAFSAFAVLKDGEWYQRGNMGWWGIVTDEKDIDVWQEEFNKLVEDLPGDTMLSIYDCHI